MREKSEAEGLANVSNETLGRNCAGGGGELMRLPPGLVEEGTALPRLRLVDGGLAEEEREPVVPLMLGTNWTDGRREPSVSPLRADPAMVGRRHGGTKVELEVAVVWVVSLPLSGASAIAAAGAAAAFTPPRGEDGERGEGDSAMLTIVLYCIDYLPWCKPRNVLSAAVFLDIVV